ncbi:hypothetical protein FRB91_006446 [Serendipita sp. 411]|nr:hypothetical protein FRB91_006446 [Serendipita sp. 411]
MSRLLGLRRKPRCFYCQHLLENAPLDPFNFECPSCTSMNHYDRETGEIRSSEPAMYDVQANSSSYARRATPDKATIPTGREQSVFCRECTVNQTLVMNMLANYLPAPSDPSYEALLATFPEYKASLETRYPLVCERCVPLVEQKLLSKEQMARAKALGGWLNASSKHTGVRRPGIASRTPSIVRPPRERPWQIYLWALQGLLYAITTGWVIISYFYGMSWKRSPPIRPPHPIFVVFSLLWTFWNRVWLHANRKRAQGLAIRVDSQKDSMRIQFLIWLSRLVMSALVSLWGGKVTEGTYGSFLAVEVALGVLAMITIRVTEPPPISLSRHNSTKEVPRKGRRSLMPSESFVNPVKPTPKPTFGTPSLLSHFMSNSGPTEEMDWTPQFNPSRTENDAFTLKPGKLSGPPTGLENLFASASLFGDEDVDMNGTSSTTARSRLTDGNAATGNPKSQRDQLLQWIRRQDILVMGSVAIAIFVLLIGAVLPAWQRQKVGVWDPTWEWTRSENSEGGGSSSITPVISTSLAQGTETAATISLSSPWIETDNEDLAENHANQ